MPSSSRNIELQQHRVVDSLFGRCPELSLIESFLDGGAAHGGALLLVGDPGCGKTVLLDAAAEVASTRGTSVLRAAGAEFDADVSFSGLNQALFPLSGEFGTLNEVHCHALRTALGFGGGAPADPRVVFTATLALLRHAAETKPLLVVVDDVHLLDRLSAAALGFVARRIRGSHVALIAASRSANGSFFGTGMQAHELQPLDEEAASSLLDAYFPSLGDRIRRRVMTEAEGNPLALLELSAAFCKTRLRSVEDARAALPHGGRSQTLLASCIRGVPAATRHLLLVAALDGTGDLRVLEAACHGSCLDDLLPAERAELIYVDEGARRLSFRHPLARATLLEVSTGSERREAHRALAEALPGDLARHAWHLADATLEADERVAGLLERVGRSALRRGDAVGAVAALLRAADTSPLGSSRSRRLAEAAYVGADVAGDLRDVSRLLVDARKADPKLSRSLQAAVATAFLLVNGEGDVDTAHRLLVGAIESRAGEHDQTDGVLVEALYTLLTVCFFGGRQELWDPFYAALRRLTPRAPRTLSLCATLFADPARAKPVDIDELESMIDRLHDEADPAEVVRIARASFFVDRMSGCREAQWRVVRDGRRGGSVASAIYALINLSLDDYLLGEWNETLQLADEGLQLCEANGYHLLAWPLWFGKAIVAAGRGDQDTLRAISDKMDQWAAPRRAGVVQLYARHARALAALGRREFESAYHDLVAISPPGELASNVPLAVWSAMDLVCAAVHTDRSSQAMAHSYAVREARLAALSPRLALISLGCEGLASPDLQATDAFEQALAIPGVHRWPFDLARVRLAYGERLRRSRAICEARVQLGAALETFKRLNAGPWATRAGTELKATGLGEALEPNGLSPQEREIARLAATGLTNKQIGERLFLSHRTVGAHLYRVFPKLGITSRAALADALRLEQSSS